MAALLKLISHKLCPYVQRAVIALTARGVAFERIDIDLASKPDWFPAISPLGKTPVLLVGDTAIFESAVILEYLEETQPYQLHPADPLGRAEHRAGSNSDRRC
jgi:glutathione S-transferase